MNKLVKPIVSLLATFSLVSIGVPAAHSGNADISFSKNEVKQQVADPKVSANNPLSFYDGRIVFDLQERVRFEARENNFDFNDSNDALTDDSWLLQRFRIGLKLKPVSWFTLYTQGQDAREWDSDRPDFPGVLGAEGDDAFDLRQANIEIGDVKLFPLTLKIGRQILSYGDERLIGAFDWNNIGRTFDAAKLHFEQKNWFVDLFASSVVVPERGSFNQSDFLDGNETGREQVFSGIYFSTTAIPVQTTDIYLLHLHQNAIGAAASSNNKNTDFFTAGFRIKSKPGAFAPQVEPVSESRTDGKSFIDQKIVSTPTTPKLVGFDYDIEAAFQSGEVRGLDHTAFAFHGGAGYTFDAPWKPRIGADYNYATGDEDSLDGENETFQNLFPTNHKFYGYMDLFSWQNMHNPAISLKFSPLKDVSIQLDGRAYWIASNDDVWYRANGTTAVRPINRDADSYEGSEFDFTVSWKASKQLGILAGYSHFWAGDYLKATGPSDDADFAYLQINIEL